MAPCCTARWERTPTASPRPCRWPTCRPCGRRWHRVRAQRMRARARTYEEHETCRISGCRQCQRSFCARAYELHAPVARTPFDGGIRLARPRGAEAGGAESRGRDVIARGQRIAHGLCAMRRERLVRRVAADVVGVSLDRERPVRVLRQQLAHFGERGLRCRVERRAVEREVDPRKLGATRCGELALHCRILRREVDADRLQHVRARHDLEDERMSAVGDDPEVDGLLLLLKREVAGVVQRLQTYALTVDCLLYTSPSPRDRQ